MTVGEVSGIEIGQVFATFHPPWIFSGVGARSQADRSLIAQALTHDRYRKP
jgi:hypothetical protein